MMESDIARAARAVNTVIDRYARDKAREIRNVIVLPDGKLATIDDPLKVGQAVIRDKKVLSDALDLLDSLIKERDGSKVSSAVSGEAERWNGSYSDVDSPEPKVPYENG